VKKSALFFFTSFRRKPESSVFKALRTDWTPVFTGVTAGIQFFHSFRGVGGIWTAALLFSKKKVLSPIHKYFITMGDPTALPLPAENGMPLPPQNQSHFGRDVLPS
jgi:hypothetical protein